MSEINDKLSDYPLARDIKYQIYQMSEYWLKEKKTNIEPKPEPPTPPPSYDLTIPFWITGTFNLNYNAFPWWEIPDLPEIEYSYDMITWEKGEWLISDPMDGEEGSFSACILEFITGGVYEKIYVRARLEDYFDLLHHPKFSSYFSSSVGGNIMSLLYGPDFNGQSEFPGDYYESSIFGELFKHLPEGCACCELILPAQTALDRCYKDMFSNGNFVKAPVILAETLSDGCFENMFSGCSNLSEVTIYASEVYQEYITGWLDGVSDTGTIYNLGGADLSSLVGGIPSGWIEKKTR